MQPAHIHDFFQYFALQRLDGEPRILVKPQQSQGLRVVGNSVVRGDDIRVAALKEFGPLTRFEVRH